MARFSVKLTMDEVGEARRAAKKRGDTGPKAAIGEKVVAIGCRRRWEGAFQKLEKWDTWKRVGRVPSSLEVRLVEAIITDLEVAEGTPEDHVIVLVGATEAPRFVIIGWAFAGDAEKQKYWRDDVKSFLLPHAELRRPWELRRERRGRGRRLFPDDPADDFAGGGKFPGMLDTDDGKSPDRVGNVVANEKYDLPCRRCQTMIPRGSLSTWSIRTGTIHGDPAECRWKSDDENAT